MKLRHLLMSAGVAALMAGAATAQETTGGTDTTTGSDTGMATGDVSTAAPAPEFTSLEEMTVGDVIGRKVVSPEGETIGEIDYVIEDANGTLAVIGIGGFLGLGEHTVALPLSDFGYDAEQRVLTLGTDKETLKAEPEFDESGIEGLPDETPVAGLLEDEAEEGASSESMSTGDADTESTSGDAATSEDSATEEGASGDAAVSEDSATEEGATDESTTEEGADTGTTSEDSATEGAAAEEGSTEDASGEDSMSEEGASEGEATEEGDTEEEIEQ